MKKAYAYIRVSSVGQAGETKDGIVRQREAITKWATVNGVEIADWFVDSVSGTIPPELRPAFQRLMAALLGNGVRTVVIEKLDRLARDTMISESAIAYFQRNEFELISTLEPDLLSTEPTRVLLRTMMAAFSQYEKSMIVLKLRGARARAKAKDPTRSEGRKKYGHRPGEQEIIKRILALDAEGMKVAAICKILNAEGTRPRGTKKHGVGEWTPQWLHQLLRKLKQQHPQRTECATTRRSRGHWMLL
jgi:DNA invertase Pin-like site-specific DNA recombinase